MTFTSDGGQVDILYSSWGDALNTNAYKASGIQHPGITISILSGLENVVDMDSDVPFDNNNDNFHCTVSFGTVVVLSSIDYLSLEYRYKVTQNGNINYISPTDNQLRIYKNAPPILYNPNVVEPSSSGDKVSRDGTYQFTVYLVDLEGDAPSFSSDQFFVQLLDFSKDSTNEPKVSFEIDPLETSPDYSLGVKYIASLNLPTGQSYYRIDYKDSFSLINQKTKEPFLINDIIWWDTASFADGLTNSLGALAILMAFFTVASKLYEDHTGWADIFMAVGLGIFVAYSIVLMILENNMLNDKSYRLKDQSPMSYFCGMMVGFAIGAVTLLRSSFSNWEDQSNVVLALVLTIISVVLSSLKDMPILKGDRIKKEVLDIVVGSFAGIAFLVAVSAFTLEKPQGTHATVTSQSFNLDNVVEFFGGICCLIFAIVSLVLLITSYYSQTTNPV